MVCVQVQTIEPGLTTGDIVTVPFQIRCDVGAAPSIVVTMVPSVTTTEPPPPTPQCTCPKQTRQEECH